MGKRGGPGHKAKALAQVGPATIAMPGVVKEALRGLPPLLQRFVVQYCGVARGNQTLAAKLAGVGTRPVQGKVYSDDVDYGRCAARGSQMYSDERVRKAIEIWMSVYAMTGAEVTESLRDLAEANLGPFLQFEEILEVPAGEEAEEATPVGTGIGRLVVKLPDEATWESHKHWLRSIEADPNTGRVTKVVLHDRLAALRELAKILKLYSDAPVFNLTLYMQKLTDDQLMTQLKEQRAAVERMMGSGG